MTSDKIELDVLCIGQAAFDVIMTVDHHPGPDEKCFASGLLSVGGGPAANASVAVARLGGSSALAGYLGLDIYGEQHLQELLREGVDTRWIVRNSNPTPLSVVLVKPNGERTVLNHKDRTPVLMPSDLDLANCHPQVILFDGHQPWISIDIAQSARRDHIPTILDAGSVHEGTLKLLPHTDFLVASSKFAQELSGKTDPGEALDALCKHCPCVVITMGEKGCVWKSGARKGSIPAFKVKVLDTTGAGDTFHGAFAISIARGQNLLAALEYASAAAALCCQKLGARPGIPSEVELRRFRCS